MLRNAINGFTHNFAGVTILDRVPKGFRAPGLRPKKCRAPGLQDGKFRALGLHCFTPGLHLAKQHFCSGSKLREALGSRLHDKYFRATGLHRPPYGTLTRSIFSLILNSTENTTRYHLELQAVKLWAWHTARFCTHREEFVSEDKVYKRCWIFSSWHNLRGNCYKSFVTHER